MRAARLSLLAAFLVAITVLPVTLRAQAAEATGTSVLTVSGSQVSAFGLTQLDYASAVYYNLGASVVLLQGTDPSNLSSVMGQDDELAPNRALVSGSVYGVVSSNQFYAAQTAHYMDLAYVVDGSGYDDEYGFSYLPGDEDWESIDQVAPDIQVFIGDEELDFGDTFDYGAAPEAILSSPLMSDVLYDPQDNGDGTDDITLSSEAYSTLFEDGFVDSATLSRSFVVCPFAPEVCAVVVGGAVVYYGARLVVDSGVLQYLWNVFSQRIPCPIGWPGYDPQTGPAGWTKMPTENGDVVYIGPNNTSAHPDLNNEGDGPHWDYNDYNRKRETGEFGLTVQCLQKREVRTVNQIKLGNEGLDFFQSFLKNGSHLGRAASQLIQPGDELVTWLPDGLDIASVSLKGGLGPGQAPVLWAPAEDLTRAFLDEARHHVALIEADYAYSQERLTELIKAGNEFYGYAYFTCDSAVNINDAASPDNGRHQDVFACLTGAGLSAERVSDLIESAFAFHQIIVLTSSAAGMVKSGSKVEKEYLTQFALAAKHLAIGAYDGSGVILWTRPDVDTNGRVVGALQSLLG